jgi:hypothetical protein
MVKDRIMKHNDIKNRLKTPEAIKDISKKTISSGGSSTKGTGSSSKDKDKRNSLSDDPSIKNTNLVPSFPILKFKDDRESSDEEVEEDMPTVNSDDNKDQDSEMPYGLNIPPEQAQVFQNWVQEQISKAFVEKDKLNSIAEFPHKVSI